MDGRAGRDGPAASTVRLPEAEALGGARGDGAQEAASAPDAPTVPLKRAGAERAGAERAGTGSAATNEGLHVSSRIGRFALIRLLGEGGMGAVYMAYDEALDRKVAVKVLHPSAVDASLWIRREALALAKLSHPNVVPVYEIGEDAGRLFLAMEYVEGRTLKAFLREEPALDGLLRVFVQAGRGLAAAHEAGLVHRDFKPDNVLIGQDGRARVVDFGIAVPANREGQVVGRGALAGGDRPIGASPNALVTPLTEAGAVLGTPSFMAPEQFQGEPATAASDQFSFCVALYRAVYRQAPFAGETILELAESVMEGALRRPPSVEGTPPWIGEVVSRGLSADPKDRYPSLSQLLDDMEARLPKDPDQDASLTRRDRRIVFGIFLVFAALVGGLQAITGPSVYESTGSLIGIGVGFFVAAAITVVALWRRLRRNVHGRMVAGLLVALAGMLIVHRTIGLWLGTPPLHIVVVDTLLFSAVFACAAITIDRRLSLVALLAMGTALGTALRPGLSPMALIALSCVAVVGSAYVSDRWR